MIIPNLNKTNNKTYMAFKNIKTCKFCGSRVAFSSDCVDYCSKEHQRKYYNACRNLKKKQSKND